MDRFRGGKFTEEDSFSQHHLQTYSYASHVIFLMTLLEAIWNELENSAPHFFFIAEPTNMLFEREHSIWCTLLSLLLSLFSAQFRWLFQGRTYTSAYFLTIFHCRLSAVTTQSSMQGIKSAIKSWTFPMSLLWKKGKFFILRDFWSANLLQEVLFLSLRDQLWSLKDQFWSLTFFTCSLLG